MLKFIRKTKGEYEVRNLNLTVENEIQKLRHTYVWESANWYNDKLNDLKNKF